MGFLHLCESRAPSSKNAIEKSKDKAEIFRRIFVVSLVIQGAVQYFINNLPKSRNRPHPGVSVKHVEEVEELHGRVRCEVNRQ